MTNEELTAAFWADLRRPFREVRRTHLRRLREEREGIAEVAVAKEKRRRRKLKRWTEQRPGQLAATRARLQGDDSSGLSLPARQELARIAALPSVTRSRRWTTAKAPRVTVDTEATRRYFHHWSASLALASLTLKARLAAAELQRQEQASYESLEAALIAEDDIPDGPWVALDEGPPLLRVIDGGLGGES